MRKKKIIIISSIFLLVITLAFVVYAQGLINPTTNIYTGTVPVNLTDVQDEDILQYDSVIGAWVNQVLSVSVGILDYFTLKNDASIPSYVEGRCYWDKTEHTIACMSDIEGTTQQLGREVLIKVRNNNAYTLNEGEIVYITGSLSGVPTISKAIANESLKADVIGVVTSTMITNAVGYINTYGLVHGIDTSSYSAGDTLYLSATTLGGLTSTSPEFPHYRIKIGKVQISHPTNGEMFIDVGIDTTNHVTINHLGVLENLTVLEDLNVTGKIHNGLSHLNSIATMVHTVPVAGTWYNISFNESLGHGFNIEFEDNRTPVIDHDGHYQITFGIGIKDSSASPNADVGMRITRNGIEIPGSYIEIDTTKQNADTWTEHTVNTELEEGDRLNMQYISSQTTVTIDQSDTYATQPFVAYGFLQELIV